MFFHWLLVWQLFVATFVPSFSKGAFVDGMFCCKGCFVIGFEGKLFDSVFVIELFFYNCFVFVKRINIDFSFIF